MVAIVQGRDHYYRRVTITNTSFLEQPTFRFGCHANHIILVNDTKNAILSFSFNGEDLDGEVFSKDKSVTLNWKITTKIWVMTDVPAGNGVRIWAWVN